MVEVAQGKAHGVDDSCVFGILGIPNGDAAETRRTRAVLERTSCAPTKEELALEVGKDGNGPTAGDLTFGCGNAGAICGNENPVGIVGIINRRVGKDREGSTGGVFPFALKPLEMGNICDEGFWVPTLGDVQEPGKDWRQSTRLLEEGHETLRLEVLQALWIIIKEPLNPRP